MPLQTPVSPLYAALLALLFFGLSVRIIRLRRRLRIAIGDADNPALLRAMRVHSNFAEYVPLTLLMIFMLEAAGASALLVQGLCASLLTGRVSHAYEVGRHPEDFRCRVLGMMMTFTALVGAAAASIAAHAWSWLR